MHEESFCALRYEYMEKWTNIRLRKHVSGKQGYAHLCCR